MMNTRREALHKILTLTAIVAIPATATWAAESSQQFAYVGCRTTKERNARGKGISVYRVNQLTGEWTLVQLLEGLDNPSFLAFDRTHRFLYAVHGDFGDISAHEVDTVTGKIRLLNRQSTGGKNPVHLVADPTNKFLIVANYATGSLVTMPIQPDGSLGAVVDLVQLPGTPGPHKTQQKSSHPHEVKFDRAGRFIVVPDKGLDKVFVYRIDASTGKLVPGTASPAKAREGAGPRHVDFHPTKPLAYVINELDSTITTCSYDENSGALVPLQVVPTMPTSFTGDGTGAEIAVTKSGRFVLGSNRGHDSVVTMAIDPSSGLLTPVAWAPTQGKGPRFFAIDPSGTNLYAANENSDSIVGFRIDSATGRLTPTGTVILTGSPVCIVFRDTTAA